MTTPFPEAAPVPPEFSALDRPEITSFVFYPRREWGPLPAGATDHLVPVTPDISVSCRFYISGHDAPTMLFFHGNGEIACDYDGIAPLYQHRGINLFVADYRGYGASGGSPSFSSMLADAHAIFRYFCGVLRGSGFADRIFVTGRSLGSAPALVLASSYQDQVRGLIVESGFASAARLSEHLGLPVGRSGLEGAEAAGLAMIRSLRLPVLIIHGELDWLLPPEEALVFHSEAGSEDKRLVLISGAGHNDILLRGAEQYFAAITEFVGSEAGEGQGNTAG